MSNKNKNKMVQLKIKIHSNCIPKNSNLMSWIQHYITKFLYTSGLSRYTYPLIVSLGCCETYSDSTCMMPLDCSAFVVICGISPLKIDGEVGHPNWKKIMLCINVDYVTTAATHAPSLPKRRVANFLWCSSDWGRRTLHPK